MTLNNNDSEYIDHSVIHHATMLGDTERLTIYKNALQQFILPTHTVVDIGSGTGILTAYAASLTHNTVYGIEYFEFSAKLAKQLFAMSPFKNVRIIENNSFDVNLKEAPDILVTETIGQIGPEENIVEICHDFVKRHPGIKHLIPNQLRVYAELITSANADAYIQSLINGYINASFQGYDYQLVRPAIYNTLANLILQTELYDAESLSKPFLLAEYQLGSTSSSSFNKQIVIPDGQRSSQVHLYFEANLSSTSKLSSRFDQSNHWKHSFIPVAVDKNCINILYQAGSNHLKINWCNN